MISIRKRCAFFNDLFSEFLLRSPYHARVNSVAPLFESGMIWAPEQKFADEVIEECAAFPYGDHDDLVDSTTQALMRFRQGGFVQHPEDYEDEPLNVRKREYYG